MAENENLKKDSAATPAEPAIHVIPPEFYGLAVRAAIQPAKPAVTPPMPSGPGPAAPPIKKEGGKAWILIPVGAVLVLAVLGYVTWQYALKPTSQKPPTAPTTKPAVTLPTPPEATPATPPVESTTTTEAATSTPPVESATTTPEPPVNPVGNDLSGAPDQDGDGLTDVEESLYGTDPSRADSDGDGFSDSVEVVNLYNPAGFKPTKLIEAGLVTEYVSAAGHYSIYYPSSWTKVENGTDVTFDNPQNQPVSVSVADNPDGKSVLDWYLSANPGIRPAQAQQFFTKSGLEGVRGPEGRTAYVSGGDHVYVISYAPGLQAYSYFRTTFQMMINSFEYRP